MGIFGEAKKSASKPSTSRYDRKLKGLEEKVEKLKTTMDAYKIAHEEMKAMMAKEFLEKYVTKLIVTDLRDDKVIVDTSDGVITIDEYSENNWLKCADTELIVNFKQGYELTLRVEKEGDC